MNTQQPIGWGSLPFEVKEAILKLLLDCGSASYLAPPVRGDLDHLAAARHPITRSAIKHICLRIILERYSFRQSFQEADLIESIRSDRSIKTAIWRLFAILGTWAADHSESLTLEIDAYSPSDRIHWHKNLLFGDD
ncbi:Uu.00g062370.m01.CDS01 [Anthostomella pinea]|uniref:Uu.00g062370.m01.CDS01 n=1 Tax=Anthostomella pinea TaxID=933095 RepID=A0AAI8VT57_9PEZI|nr:Uu.00g062370.m01.CDS01 [Anthostomella pinea]